MAADQPARGELHLPDSRDRERDRDIHFLLTVLGDADAKDPAPRPRRARRSRRPGGKGARRPRCAFVDVAKRAEQTVGLLGVDLSIGQELEDLLSLFARHLTVPSGLVQPCRYVVHAHLAFRETLEKIADLRGRGRAHRCGALRIPVAFRFRAFHFS